MKYQNLTRVTAWEGPDFVCTNRTHRSGCLDFSSFPSHLHLPNSPCAPVCFLTWPFVFFLSGFCSSGFLNLDLFQSLSFVIFIFLLYNTVLVLPYIDMNSPGVYMSSQSWMPLPQPSPDHLSGSSQCTSPKHPVSCIEPRLVIRFLHDSIHVSMPFSQIIPNIIRYWI